MINCNKNDIKYSCSLSMNTKKRAQVDTKTSKHI